MPTGARVVAVEAGTAWGWDTLTTTPQEILSIDRFGASGPGDKVATLLGLTVERLVERIAG